MPDPKRRFEVIEGGTTKRSEPPLIDTGTVGQDKPRLTRAKAGSGGGRGGGGQAVTIARLEERLSGAFKWLAVLTAAFGAAFMFFLWMAWGVRGDISSMEQNVAVQSKAISGIERSLDRIEDRLDSQRQAVPIVGEEPKNGKK